MKRIIILAFSLLFGGLAHAQSIVNAPTTINAGTVTGPNVFANVLSVVGTATSIRRSLEVMNNNASDKCYLYLGTTANASTATAILLTSGVIYARYYPYVPSDAVNIACASTGDTYYVGTQ